MNRFENAFHTRNEEVDGVGPWMWQIADNGAWDGPKRDYEESHKYKIQKYVENWNVVVQAGGCHGMYPRLLSKLFKRVYTFEPDPLNFHCLVNNCQETNVFKINSALGAECKLIDVEVICPTNTGMNVIKEGGETKFTPMLTIDTLNLDDCGFIWLDVESYEINILEGARQTIEKYKPVIATENANDRIRSLLDGYGYRAMEDSVSDTFFKVG